MWYKYLIPRKVVFLGRNYWRWFNLLIVAYPKNLVWEVESKGNCNFCAYVLGKETPYVIAPSEDGQRYSFYGPGLPVGYRPTLETAALACSNHYRRNILAEDGI